MLTRKFSQTALILGLSLTTAGGLIGCGTPQAQVKTADHIQAGALPAGGEWHGVYYNQTFGFLHITEQNGAVQGAWRTTAGDKWGELYGEVKGNLLKFTWTERKVGIVGPAAESKGKGYFLYTAPKEGEAHELQGEWGLGDNEVGHPWNCVKQLNQEPDPKSVRPNELENSVGAIGFDGDTGDGDLALPEDAPAETDEPQEESEASPSPL